MSLINCPECGQQISDSAKQCVHCGCTVSICKECGKTMLGKIDTCPNCGYQINVKNKPELTNEKYKDLNDVINTWQTENKLASFSNIITLALWAISAILFIIAISSLISWKGGTAVNVLSTKDQLDSTKTLCIIGAILFFSAFVLYDYEFIPFSLYSWAERKDIDLKNYLKKALETDIKKLSGESGASLTSNIIVTEQGLRYSDDLTSRANQQKFSAIKIILSAISTLFLCLFVINNVESYLEKVFIDWDATFSLSDIVDLWLLIVAIISIVIKKFVNKIHEKKELQLSDYWVKENLPDHYKQFMHLSKEGFEYFWSDKHADKRIGN